MKHTISIILVVAVILSVLTGCGATGKHLTGGTSISSDPFTCYTCKADLHDYRDLVESWTTTYKPKKFDSLEEGSYTIFEIKAPNGYRLPLLNYRYFTVESGSEGIYVNFVNTAMSASVKIKKTDKSGNLLPNATLELVCTNYNPVKVIGRWNTNEENPKVFSDLPLGNYSIREINAPDGFYFTSPTNFTITSSDDMKTLEYTVVNNPTVVRIKKVDSSGNALAGAELELYGPDGELIKAWTSTTNYREFKGLLIGEEYTIKETQAPDGYAVSASKTFVVSPDEPDQTITFENKRLPNVGVIKLDENGNHIGGANLSLEKQLSDGSWSKVDSWTSTEYSTTGPSMAYVRITDSAFNIQAGEYLIIAKSGNKFYAMKREGTGTGLSAVLLQNMTGLSDILDASAVDEALSWMVTVSGSGVRSTYKFGDGGQNYLYVSSSPTALNYGANEGSVFNGSATSHGYKFYTSATRSVWFTFNGSEFVANTNSAAVSEVYLFKKQLADVSDTHIVAGLSLGKYRIFETNAPDGYVVSSPVEFTLTEKNYGKLVGIEMYNYPTETDFLKLNEDGAPFPGAKLAVIAKNIATEEETVIEQWVSTMEPHTIKGLLTDEQATARSIRYYLRELEAPAGCKKADDVLFFVGNGEETVTVTMTNIRRATLLIEKIDENGNPLADAVMSLEILVDDEWQPLKQWTTTAEAFDCGVLDDGTYRLSEIEAPKGYLRIVPVEIQILGKEYKIGNATWATVGPDMTIRVQAIDRSTLTVPTGIFFKGLLPTLAMTLTGLAVVTVYTGARLTRRVKARRK